MATKTFKYVLEVILDEDAKNPSGWIKETIAASLESGEDFNLTTVDDNEE